MSELIKAAVAGGAFVAVIDGVREWLNFRRKRKAELEDRADTDMKGRLKSLEDKVDLLMQGSKYIMYDRIRYLAMEYIMHGEVDFDDRRILNDMHGVYHREGGNGDLDNLMRDVNSLPLKKGA